MVYVDPLVKNGWKYGPNCHLFADSQEELVSFAVKIGLNPVWIQKSNLGLIHFDLTASKRKRAVTAGAKELSKYEMADYLRKNF